MDYQEAERSLGKRDSRKLANNTYLERRGPYDIALRLHDTAILTFHCDGSTMINSGGWLTPTTKDRLRRYLPHGWTVDQKRRAWYLRRGSEIVPYADGATIRSDGEVVAVAGGHAVSVEEIRKYAKAYIKALSDGHVPAPSSGDCWFCSLVADDGRTMGEAVNDTEHLQEHIRHGYFVPSLLQRAIELLPCSQAAKWFLADLWGEKEIEGNRFYEESVRRQLDSALRRYLCRQLGYAS